jgi:hypothetical protein
MMDVMISRSTLLALVAVCLIPSAALSAEEKKKAGGGFIQIDTLTAQVTAAGGRHAVMTVQSGVDVQDEKLHAYAALVQPRLRDAYNRELQVYASGMPPGAPPNADYIAQRMQQATDRVLGKPGGRWLIGGVMIN